MVNVIEVVPSVWEMNNDNDISEIVNNFPEDVVIKRIYSLMCWREAAIVDSPKDMWIKWRNIVDERSG